jgi:hypothetical protein
MELFAWLGLSADQAFCEQALERCSIKKLNEAAVSSSMPIPGQKNPQGFFRKGKAGTWRSELSGNEVRIVEHVCHDLMVAAGYEPERNGRGAPLRLPIHDGLQRIRESLDWQLQKLLHRI